MSEEQSKSQSSYRTLRSQYEPVRSSVKSTLQEAKNAGKIGSREQRRLVRDSAFSSARSQFEHMLPLLSKDEDTGLDNRHGFNSEMMKAVAEVKRAAQSETKQPSVEAGEKIYFTVILLDANNLKKVNEISGHAAGDKFIKDIADVLRSEQRPTEPVSRLNEYSSEENVTQSEAARLGGDEFGVILYTDAEGARHWWKRKAATFKKQGISIGAGYAVCNGRDLLGLPNEETHAYSTSLKEIADQCLFAAKYISKKDDSCSLFGQKEMQALPPDEKKRIALYRAEQSKKR